MKQARIINTNGFHCLANGTIVNVGGLSGQSYECETDEDGFVDNDFCPDWPELLFREAGFFQYVPVDQLEFI